MTGPAHPHMLLVECIAGVTRPIITGFTGRGRSLARTRCAIFFREFIDESAHFAHPQRSTGLNNQPRHCTPAR